MKIIGCSGGAGGGGGAAATSTTSEIMVFVSIHQKQLVLRRIQTVFNNFQDIRELLK